MRLVFTGNIGCGKSTAVSITVDLLPTYKLFDFDAVVLELYQNQTVCDQLIGLFGTAEKSAISKIVYKDPEAMKSLRSLMDPLMISEANQYTTFPNVIYDIPLFFEFGTRLGVVADAVLCVSADRHTQVSRVRSRNGWPIEVIDRIISNQLPQHKKEELSDVIILNNGTLSDLQFAVAQSLIQVGAL